MILTSKNLEISHFRPMEILSNHLLKLSGCYPEVSDRQNDAISLDRGFSDSLPVAIGTAIVLFCVFTGEGGERDRERPKRKPFLTKEAGSVVFGGVLGRSHPL